MKTRFRIESELTEKLVRYLWRRQTEFFQWVCETVSFHKWYFGHWNQDKETEQKYRELLIDMETGEKVW